jgi:hypothetical protein
MSQLEVVKAARSDWVDRVVRRGVRVRVDSLLHNPMNWRIHPLEQQQVIAASLGRLGWLQAIRVNEVTGHIIDGHQRVLEADKAGQQTVVVDVLNLTEEEEREALALVDTVTALAVTDASKLDELLQSLLEDHDGAAISPDETLDAFLQGLCRTPAEQPSGTRGMVPEERLEIYENNPIRQLVLHFAQADYEPILAVLAWSRKHYGVETNTEAVTLLMWDAWQSHGAPDFPGLVPDWRHIQGGGVEEQRAAALGE